MPTSAAEPLLQVKGLNSGYGKIVVLHGVDFHVDEGEVVTLLGKSDADIAALRTAGIL